MLIDILQVLLGVIMGCILGFFVAKHFITKQLKENPPINEQMIKMMMSSMGRTPNQKQVNQMMNAMKKNM